MSEWRPIFPIGAISVQRLTRLPLGLLRRPRTMDLPTMSKQSSSPPCCQSAEVRLHDVQGDQIVADSRTSQDFCPSLRRLGRPSFQRHYLACRYIPSIHQVAGSGSVLTFLVGGLAPLPQSKKQQLGTDRLGRSQKTEAQSTIVGNYTVPKSGHESNDVLPFRRQV